MVSKTIPLNQRPSSELTVPQQLFQAVEKVDREGNFYCQESMSAPLPGLDVMEVGPIALPLTAGQAKQIKAQCEQAPYGKGEKTLVDKKVRKVWRMTPDRFLLSNPDWVVFLHDTVAKVGRGLGLEGQKLRCHLYDLLLYEKGSFFLPHRDGEKFDGMVATLVVVLPSTFEGGELLIRHENSEARVDFGGQQNSQFQTHFVAFYADCEHEVKPLREGHRLCLVYNLTLEKSSDRRLAAPCNLSHIDEVSGVLSKWAANGGPVKLALPLEHQYTQHGLSWQTLKGLDRSRAQVLCKAASLAGFKAHLARLTFWEHGSAYEYDEPRASRWSYRHKYYDHPDSEADDDDDNDDDGADTKSADCKGSRAGEYVMEEVFDSSLIAAHLIDDHGLRLPTESMRVMEEEVVPQDALKKVVPEEEFEGYTGNAGMTLERWYHHAAILLWPVKSHYQILCNCGTESAVAALNLQVAAWRQDLSSAKDKLKAQCVEFANLIVDRWTPVRVSRIAVLEDPDSGNILPALEALGDVDLINKFLSKVCQSDPLLEMSPSFLKTCERLGMGLFDQGFLNIFENTNLSNLERNVRLLEQLSSSILKNAKQMESLRAHSGREIVVALIAIDQAKTDWRSPTFNRPPAISALIRALINAREFTVLNKLIGHVLASSAKYPVSPVLIQTALILQDWLPIHLEQACSVTKLVEACCKHLKSATTQVPQPPSTFARKVDIACRCGDCKELVAFLESPTEKVHRFSVKKSRRQHLHITIDRYQCDLEHVTERKGSPQTLVCTKNLNAYKRSLVTYENDKKDFAAIAKLAMSLKSAGA